MARRPALGGFSLDLFGGGGVDAGVFNIASQSKQNEAYLALTRVEVQWEAGMVSNADYLAALQTYVNTFPENTSERLNQQARYDSTVYRIERNVLISQVNAGTKTLSDLLDYDSRKLEGLNQDSQEYLDRQSRLFQTQGQLLNEEEREVTDSYQDGKMTTAQLRAWYAERLADPRFAGNTDLLEQVTRQVADLDTRIVDERDAKMISDYSAGKVAPLQFLAYANAARSRYAEGSQAAQDWDKRIEQVKDSAVEDDLAYRYGLSQDYLRLKQFVQGNQKPSGGTSTSTSTRTILGSDGKWHVVKSTSTKPTKPSAGEVEAWRKRQVEVTAARRQMDAIAKKLNGFPGGFVQTGEMLAYYKKQLGTVKRGSSEWYSIQGKIDGLNDALASEKVLGQQGVKLSFPKIKSEKPEKYQIPGGGGGGSSGGSSSSGQGAAAKGSGGGGDGADASGLTLKAFMKAIAKVESGGRYDARNSSTGAYGKYQILPSNWPSYAKKAGLPPDAEPTPENQEKVALAAFTRYFKKYDGDWSAMAAAWFAGVAGSRGGPSSWGPRTRNYVSNVLGAAGVSYTPGRSSGSSPRPSGTAPVGGKVTTAAPGTGKAPKPGKPTLKIITGVSYTDRESRQVTRTGEIPDYAQELTYGREEVTTKTIGIPKGLDARQFRKVYDALESAFRNGEEAAVIDLGGGNVLHIFVGDDPDERIKLMRSLDDLRVDLADVEAKAYRGTGSEAIKSQAAVAARREAAGHELVILDTAGTSQGGKTNPVAAATRILDKITSGIATETALMNAAYKRGDLTEAYLHAQKINQLTSGASLNGQTVNVDLRQLTTLVNEANNRIAAIQRGTGLSIDQLTSGLGTAGTALDRDLERLANAATEIAKAAEPGAETAQLLNNQLKKDGDGQIVWSGTGQRGQVQLKDDFIRTIKPNGQVAIEPAEPPQVGEDGSIRPGVPKGKVKTFLKSGSSVLDAYADYAIGTVGYALMPDGVTKVPITGKIVSIPVDQNNDGTYDSVSTYFENPLKPGKWSSTAIMYKAPKGTKVVYDADSQLPAFQFGGGGDRYVTLKPDPKTGVYVVFTEQSGHGLLGVKTEPVPLGTGAQSPEAATYLGWWERDMSGTSFDERALAESNAPALGFSSDEWAETQIMGSVQALRDFSSTMSQVAGRGKVGPLTRQDLARRAVSAGPNKAGQMAMNADIARDLLDERKTPGQTEAERMVEFRASERASLTKLPTAKTTQGSLGTNLNRDLAVIDARMAGERAPALKAPVKNKPVTGRRAAPRPTPRRISKLPTKKKPKPTGTASVNAGSRNLAL